MSTTSSRKSSISPTNSISLIKLDELSSFGATKQSRLPALIKLNEIDQNQPQAVISMPNFSASQIEKTPAEQAKTPESNKQAASLPVNVAMTDKENMSTSSNKDADQNTAQGQQTAPAAPEQEKSLTEDFQVVEMEQANEMNSDSNNLMGPSLPLQHEQIERSIQALQSSNSQHSTQLGDSLIEMIINLKNENQNLVRALEMNNDYVKERLSEFKKIQEESKRREAQFALEKAEHEHQIRKLTRQNEVLSERLKSMEAKLKDMKVEVSESLNAAHSSQASSLRGPQDERTNLYPSLGAQESFGNSALNNNQTTTMQVDATSGELYNEGDTRPSDAPIAGDSSESTDESGDDDEATAGEQQAGPSRAAIKMANMSKEELEKHFDTNKAQFYALDDPMKQCDKLEQQLNEIGKRDYEICLLQQQLNIYRQDFRLERMANLEAKIQIEKLKNDIDKLCLDRIQQTTQAKEAAAHSSRHHERGVRFYPTGAAENLIGKLGHQLSKKAAKSAAKAAKYAAKQAHREERTAAALARAAAYTSAATNPASGQEQVDSAATHGNHHHRRHHGHHSRPRQSGIRSEVMTDLLSTANKAMLTGYKMASTHVNLALDKLSQYEQQQASALEKNKQPGAVGGGLNAGATSSNQPSAPMPSID